jgi:hypothetical protein
MIERSLMLRVLTALDAVDTTGIRENILLDEIALEASRHLEASQIREHLAEAKRKGWAESYVGTLRETRWRLLEPGRNTIFDLRG